MVESLIALMRFLQGRTLYAFHSGGGTPLYILHRHAIMTYKNGSYLPMRKD